VLGCSIGDWHTVFLYGIVLETYVIAIIGVGEKSLTLQPRTVLQHQYSRSIWFQSWLRFLLPICRLRHPKGGYAHSSWAAHR